MPKQRTLYLEAFVEIQLNRFLCCRVIRSQIFPQNVSEIYSKATGGHYPTSVENRGHLIKLKNNEATTKAYS